MDGFLIALLLTGPLPKQKFTKSMEKNRKALIVFNPPRLGVSRLKLNQLRMFSVLYFLWLY